MFSQGPESLYTANSLFTFLTVWLVFNVSGAASALVKSCSFIASKHVSDKWSFIDVEATHYTQESLQPMDLKRFRAFFSVLFSNDQLR